MNKTVIYLKFGPQVGGGGNYSLKYYALRII